MTIREDFGYENAIVRKVLGRWLCVRYDFGLGTSLLSASGSRRHDSKGRRLSPRGATDRRNDYDDAKYGTEGCRIRTGQLAAGFKSIAE